MSDELSKSAPDQLRVKALGLFDYLKALIQLRSSVTRDSGEYVDVLWLSHLPQQEGCYCAGWPKIADQQDHSWVELKKQSLPKIPSVPDVCSNWVDPKVLTDPNIPPELKEKIQNPNWTPKENSSGTLFSDQESETAEPSVAEFLVLSDFPEIEAQWFQYVETKWKPWTKDYLTKKKVQDIYSRLFSMHQQQKALGESYEVVLGFGYLCWKTPSDQNIARHIICAQSEIDFDPNQGMITVRPAAEGACPQFEMDMLEPNERPPYQIYLNLQDTLKTVSDDVWHNSALIAVIRSWVQSLSSNGNYVDSWTPERSFERDPKVFLAPALILRKRTTRGYLKFIDQIVEQIKQPNCKIPKAVQLYVDIEDSKHGNGKSDEAFDCQEFEGDSTAASSELEKVYFPLASNDEQREIISKLKRSIGVLVQGPPGTGKSHTIANLICHLLAQNKRILITSQTSRALKVLMQKLPAKIQPLCVNLLGLGIGDLQSMEASIGEINRRYASWNERTSIARIQKLVRRSLSSLGV